MCNYCDSLSFFTTIEIRSLDIDIDGSQIWTSRSIDLLMDMMIY
jgi:hypothetical protein